MFQDFGKHYTAIGNVNAFRSFLRRGPDGSPSDTILERGQRETDFFGLLHPSLVVFLAICSKVDQEQKPIRNCSKPFVGDSNAAYGKSAGQGVIFQRSGTLTKRLTLFFRPQELSMSRIEAGCSTSK